MSKRDKESVTLSGLSYIDMEDVTLRIREIKQRLNLQGAMARSSQREADKVRKWLESLN